jgi:glycosyltransferase involved in cell wall biosynthesis
MTVSRFVTVKIIVSAFTYPPNVDGVATAARQMVENFKNAGHEVIVTTGRSLGQEGHTNEHGVEIRRFEITGGPAFGVGFHGETAAYQQFVLESSADLIVCHCWNTWNSELLYPLMPGLRSKTILASHGYSAHMLEPAILPRGIGIWMRRIPCVLALPIKMRRLDLVVFLSGKTDLRRYFDVWVSRVTGCPNTRVIPNGIDTSGWQAITPDFRKSHQLEGGVFFLCVANYFTGKNQMMALAAFTQANIPGSVLVFIGSSLGEYGAEVFNSWNGMRDRFPSIDVRFLEKLPREEIIAATMSCDVAVLPSRSEAQPLTILESMACGKPFISTDVGCVSELKGGIIVHDTSDMAAAMKHLGADPDERTRLGAEGKRDFETHYNAEVTKSRWLHLLDEVSHSR